MTEDTNNHRTPEDCGASASHCSGDICRLFFITKLEQGHASECVAVSLQPTDGDPDFNDNVNQPLVIEVFEHNAKRLYVGQTMYVILRSVEEMERDQSMITNEMPAHVQSQVEAILKRRGLI